MKKELFALICLAGLSAPGISWAQSCNGTLVAERKVPSYRPDGPYVPSLGTLRIYRTPRSNGASYCAMAVHSDRTWGIALSTTVWMKRCWRSEFDRYGQCVQPGQVVQDQGSYRYYAGPVTLQVARHQCFMAVASIQHPVRTEDVFPQVQLDHCVQ